MPLQFTFTDASYYEPSAWSWDFGDGTLGQDTSPVHTFPASGVYKVCLTVSNANASDTYCREVPVGTIAARHCRRCRVYCGCPKVALRCVFLAVPVRQPGGAKRESSEAINVFLAPPYMVAVVMTLPLLPSPRTGSRAP